jgi:carbonic anhydrase/acetyltransferase-like protein (isoleucine patch superfamily)
MRRAGKTNHVRRCTIILSASEDQESDMRQIGDSYIAHSAVVRGDVVLSAGVNIWFGCVLRADLARITLGPRVNLQDGCIVHTDHDEPQVIEEGVVVGHGAMLHGRLIGKDTLVGMGAILLSGCEVGAECLIAAGTLVTEKRRIPPRSLVMGVPGKVVRAVTDEDLRRTLAINAHYLELAQRYTRGAFPPPWKEEPV